MSYLETIRRIETKLSGRAKETEKNVQRYETNEFNEVSPASESGIRPTTCAPSCYEIQPGRWVHHPWDGCTTTSAVKVDPKVTEAPCWHCGGEKTCKCFCCAILVSGGAAKWKPGECHVCRGTGLVMVWVH